MKAKMAICFAGIFLCWSQGSVEAATVYNWVGTCATGLASYVSCTGAATGVLTLNGGTPFNFNQGNFVSWEFDSSAGSFGCVASTTCGAYGRSLDHHIVVDGIISSSIATYMWMGFPGVPLTTGPDGQPLLWFAGICPYPDGSCNSVGFGVYGSDYSFAEVPGDTPLLATLPLFATGLCALGLLGWRRKRKNAAALVA